MSALPSSAATRNNHTAPLLSSSPSFPPEPDPDSKESLSPSSTQQPPLGPPRGSVSQFFQNVLQQAWGSQSAAQPEPDPSDLDFLDDKDETPSDYRDRSRAFREERQSNILYHVENVAYRWHFIINIAKAFLSFGAPYHRVESMLITATIMLKIEASFVCLPGLLIFNFTDRDTQISRAVYLRANGRIQLTRLQAVHAVYRRVLHDEIGVSQGNSRILAILACKPVYSTIRRCIIAFCCSSILCILSFGGSMVDMCISGLFAFALQCMGLIIAVDFPIYANIYEFSGAVLVSFVSRGLETIPGNIFCYSAISSAGVVLLLPGYIILTAALEIISKSLFLGSMRAVYAIIYSMTLGFGLTLGSDLFLVMVARARQALGQTNLLNSRILHGSFLATNGSSLITDTLATIVLTPTEESGRSRMVKGCYRDPSWPFWRQSIPWWGMFILVPLYSVMSSMGNQQSVKDFELVVMVVLSCAAFTANRFALEYFPKHATGVSSAAGAFVIGLLGNMFSRMRGTTPFTSMITGVLFLVPSAIGNGGGLLETAKNDATQYSHSFNLGIQMIQVAVGVSCGLQFAQIIIYMFGRRKRVGHFTF